MSAAATVAADLIDDASVKVIAEKIGTPARWDKRIQDFSEQMNLRSNPPAWWHERTHEMELGKGESLKLQRWKRDTLTGNATDSGEKGHVEVATESGEKGTVEAAIEPGEKGDVEAKTEPREEVHVEQAPMEDSLLQDWREKWESDLIRETLALKSQLQVIEQPKDCKCLFHCWSHHLASPGLNADALRTAACDEMALRDEVFSAFLWIKVRV